MSAFSTWVQSHSVIAIVLATVALGFRVFGLVQKRRHVFSPARSTGERGGDSNGGTVPKVGTWQRVRNGASFGAICPGLFSVLIWLIYLFGGRFQQDNGVTTDFLVLSIAYPLGSLLMGAILGLGLPMMRNFASSSMVGMIAIAPLSIGIGLSMDNALTHRTSGTTVVVAVVTVFLGMAIGYGATNVTRQRVAVETTRSPKK